MADITFSLPALFENAFGYRPDALEFPEQPDPTRYANLGSPYYATDAKGREYYMPVELGGVKLHHPVTRVSLRNRLIETTLTEVGGDAVEFIGAEAYQLRIRGLIIANDTTFPENEVTELKDLINRRQSLTIRSVMTDIFLITTDRKGFNEVIIKDFDFPEMPGVKNVRAYELGLISNQPFSLEMD